MGFLCVGTTPRAAVQVPLLCHFPQMCLAISNVLPSTPPSRNWVQRQGASCIYLTPVFFFSSTFTPISWTKRDGLVLPLLSMYSGLPVYHTHFLFFPMVFFVLEGIPPLPPWGNESYEINLTEKVVFLNKEN